MRFFVVGAPLVDHRPQLERTVLDGVARGVRTVVIRPSDVYGDGGAAPARWVQSVRESARFVGNGTSHWASIGRMRAVKADLNVDRYSGVL